MINTVPSHHHGDLFIEGEMELDHAIHAQKARDFKQAASAYCLARDYFSLALLSPDIQAVPSLAWVVEKKLLKIRRLLGVLNKAL